MAVFQPVEVVSVGETRREFLGPFFFRWVSVK